MSPAHPARPTGGLALPARVVAFTASLTALALVAACGGANPTDLFDGPASTSLGSDPGAGSNGAGSNGGDSNGGDSNGSSGSGGSSGSIGVDGGTATDAGKPDAGDPKPWKSPGVFCGKDQVGPVYCGDGELCCGRTAGNEKRWLECVPDGIAACAAGVSIRCDDQTDCPGAQICCGTFDPYGGYRDVRCANDCNAPIIPGLVAVRFCDINAPTDECAAIGLTCTASDSLGGFAACR